MIQFWNSKWYFYSQRFKKTANDLATKSRVETSNRTNGRLFQTFGQPKPFDQLQESVFIRQKQILSQTGSKPNLRKNVNILFWIWETLFEAENIGLVFSLENEIKM